MSVPVPRWKRGDWVWWLKSHSTGGIWPFKAKRVWSVEHSSIYEMLYDQHRGWEFKVTIGPDRWRSENGLFETFEEAHEELCKKVKQ